MADRSSDGEPGGYKGTYPRTSDGQLLHRILAAARDRKPGSLTEKIRLFGNKEVFTPIIGAAFALMAIRWLPDDSERGDVTRFVAQARADLAGEFDLSEREAEGLIRSVLWHEAHLIANIDAHMLVDLQLALLKHMIRALGVSADEIAALMVDAEQLIEKIDLSHPLAGEILNVDILVSANVAAKARPGEPDTGGLQRPWTPVPIGPGSDAGATGPVDGGPKSMLGLFFRAVATNQPEVRDYWLGELDRTGNMNFHQGVIAVFLTAVWRRFRGRKPREVAYLVKRMSQFYAHGRRKFWPLETEMLIRDALGERVPIDGISIPVSEAKMLVAGSIFLDLGLSLGELDALLLEAERLAEKHGYPLTPA